MKLTKHLILVSSLILLLLSVAAIAQRPNFGPGLWGDGELWGTKAAAPLPAPNGRNNHSFDKLFVIVNSNNPVGQLPVGEAAPGNPHFNGGRWFTHTVEWTAEGFAAHGTVPVLMSYEEVMLHYPSARFVVSKSQREATMIYLVIGPLPKRVSLCPFQSCQNLFKLLNHFFIR